MTQAVEEIKKVVSDTPKTDEQIIKCFDRSRTLVRIWTVVFAVLFMCGLALFLYLTGAVKLSNKKELFFSIWGAVTGSSSLTGVGYNIITLIGFKNTCKCLEECGDEKTKEFLKKVKRMQKYTILDTLLFFLPPVKFFTTFRISTDARKLREMLSEITTSKTDIL